ncbi:hypothetical protein L6452_14197 [Arctium lappa]|uniref:Uncharacterized protein n=1 Tax=Arctium lappa TaxID=4217 RepID=A0ACB9CKE2_ARCLA|nr:hypothetical protein L6452_14197 [Arctium lappa]
MWISAELHKVEIEGQRSSPTSMSTEMVVDQIYQWSQWRWIEIGGDDGWISKAGKKREGDGGHDSREEEGEIWGKGSQWGGEEMVVEGVVEVDAGEEDGEDVFGPGSRS